MASISNPKAANRFGRDTAHIPRAAGLSSESAARRCEKIPATPAPSASAVKIIQDFVDLSELCHTCAGSDDPNKEARRCRRGSATRKERTDQPHQIAPEIEQE